MENQYKELLSKVNAGNKCIMLTALDKSNGFILDKILLPYEEIDQSNYEFNGIVCLNQYSEGIQKASNLALDTGSLQSLEIDNNKLIVIEPFIPKPRLIVFGGGHISKPLTEFAARTGFSVTVIDDRPSFANPGRFPEADEVVCESFERSFSYINFRKSDFVVIVTRGHRYDGLVLREVLHHEITYLGMIGSKRRVRGMMEELSDEGYSKDRLNKVCSPIGLDIAAVTPDEIAISIVAQLINCKNKGTMGKSGKKFNIPEFDMEVVEKIYEVAPMPKALITILCAKGSVPRKAGAKMIAYYDGRTIGSIGGGCSEAAVLTKAREIMQTKGFSIEHVDMTGEVAESEGMVCGGVMDVLVEVF